MTDQWMTPEAATYTQGRWCNRAAGHSGEHDFNRTDVTNTVEICGPIPGLASTRTPPNVPLIHGRDASSLAFYVRDFLDAAGYRYSPDGPLHGQVRECCELIQADREEIRVRRAHETEDRDRDAAEVQRLEDLVTELRKHLTAREQQALDLSRMVDQRDTELGLIQRAIDDELGEDHAMSLSSRVRALAPRLRPASGS